MIKTRIEISIKAEWAWIKAHQPAMTPYEQNLIRELLTSAEQARSTRNYNRASYRGR